MTYPSTSATAGFVAEAKRRFTTAGIAISVVSGGGTPNAWHAHEVIGLTEVRVGTYIYHDRATVAADAASLDECALHMRATVVSRPTDDRAVIDAGTKSLTSDLVATSVGPGYGMILGYPDAVIERLNEEHGIIDLSRCGAKPAVGEQVAIVPNHVCVVSNLHDEVVLSRDGRVVDTWRSRGGRRAETWCYHINSGTPTVIEVVALLNRSGTALRLALFARVTSFANWRNSDPLVGVSRD